jgi:hypothetical protein
MKEYKFSDSFPCGDMTKWGASDFYEDKAEEIKKAIASGLPFDTGWGGCKKEILSSRVSFDGKKFICQVSVSDDFDTEGMGRESFESYNNEAINFSNIVKSLDLAADGADENLKENAPYRGFKLLWRGGWHETYIQAKCDYPGKEPPGDNYHQWGFQGETEDLTEEEKEKIEDWIMGWPDKNEVFEIGEWKVECWDKE